MEDAIPQNHLVTVIVPCYNGARFLEETLESALRQTYPHVEVIVVDDGSTDDSAEIARRFPIRYLYQDNCGLSNARNAGIRESRGAYVLFLDADDRLRPEAIECGVRILESHPECALTIGDHVFISADGRHLKNSLKVAALHSHYESLLKSNFIEMISSVLFRRRVFEEVGAFDSALRVAEDYDLYLRIARVRPICCHTAVIAEYRIHTANASHNSELMLITTLQVLKSQACYMGDAVGRLQAYREGVRAWRTQYGRQLTMELATGWAALAGKPLCRKLAVLAVYYPQGLLLLLFLMLPAIRKRRSRWSRRIAYDGVPR